jgi:signal peptidase II
MLHRNGRVFWIAAVAVLTLDVVTKWWAVERLALHSPQPVIGELLRFTLAYNRGAAFSMHIGPYSRYVFAVFAAVALVVLHRLYRKSSPGEWQMPLGLGLAWGGAAGNLIDRIRWDRGVVDFIDVGTSSWRFWTFNVADSGVTIGAIILAWLLSREEGAREGEKIIEAVGQEAEDTREGPR